MPRFDHNLPAPTETRILLRRLDVDRAMREARLPRYQGTMGRSGEVYGLCPNPEHRDKRPGSWSIRHDPGRPLNGRSHCYACGWDGDAIEVLARLLRVGLREAFDKAVATWALDVREPVDSVLPAVMRDGWYAIEPVDLPPAEGIIPGSACHRYLLRRGFGPDDIDLDGMLDWREAERVLIPCRMFGQVVSYDARLYGEDRRPGVDEDIRAKKVLSPPRGRGGANAGFAMHGLDVADRSTGLLTLTEGWGSRARLRQAGLPNPVGVRTAELTDRKAALLGWARDIVVFREGDRGGRLMEASVNGWLADDGVRIRAIICGEGKDPADYTAGELIRMVGECA
jgi:hypothetical protein